MSEYYYKNSGGALVADIPLSDEKIDVTLYFKSIPAINYDLYDDTKKNSMFFDTNTLNRIDIVNKRGSGNRIWLYSAEIFIVWGNNFMTSNLLADIPFGESKVTNGDNIYHVFGGKYDGSLDGTENDMWWAGDCELLVRLQFRDKNNKKFVCWFRPKMSGAGIPNPFQMHVYRPTLVSINIGETKKDFYLYENFSVDYGAVKATYKYEVDGSNFEEKVFSNFTSNPEIGTTLENTNPNTPGLGFTKTVTISFGGKSNSYNINVHGVNEETTFSALPQMPRFLPAGADIDAIEDEYLYGTITYDDGTTSPDERASMSFQIPTSYVGKVPVKYSIRVPKLCKWKTVDGYQQVVIDRRLSYGDDSNGYPMTPVYTERIIG